MHTLPGAAEPTLSQDSVPDHCPRCGGPRSRPMLFADPAQDNRRDLCREPFHGELKPKPEELKLTAGGMYPAETTDDNKPKHSRHCKALFGRKDWKCQRCLALMHKAAPRGSWHRQYAARKLRARQGRLHLVLTA